MAVVDTVLAPREVLNRLYERIRALYDKILRADTRRAQSDRAMEAEIEQINALVKKLDFSFIRKVMNDASASKQSYQEVKEFEKLLDEITAESKYAVRQEHYIYRTAKSVRRSIRRLGKKTLREGRRKNAKVQKEKKKLVKDEAQARVMMGKKTK